MKIKMRNCLAILFGYIFAAFGNVHAELDIYPRMGVIASNSEMASINYSCSKPKGDKGNYRKMECDIYYQTLKKGEPKFDKAMVIEEYKKKGVISDMCFVFTKKNIADMTLAEVQAEINNLDEFRNSFYKDMFTEMTPVLQKMCKEKTLDSVLKFAEFIANFDANTCEIESSKTKEVFTELPQKKGSSPLWISEGSPLPPCGRKDIIKFVPIKDNRWSLQFEYVVFNKQARDDNGKMCKEFDGARNIFNSQNTTWNLPCKHIKIANKAAWDGPFNPK